jgi:hypothetical protein
VPLSGPAYYTLRIFMLQLESRPRLVGLSEGKKVFKTRLTINKPCLQNKICFQFAFSHQQKETIKTNKNKKGNKRSVFSNIAQC